MLEKIKKDKLKAATIIASIVVFIVGIIVTVVNSGDTYAIDLSDAYACNSGGYSPVQYSGNYYCCPVGGTVQVNMRGEYECVMFYTATQASTPGTIAYKLTNGNAGTDTDSCFLQDSGSSATSGYSYSCYVSTESVLNKYLVTYDLNGGSGNIAMDTKIQGTSLKLSSSIPKRSGYIFKGWSTNKSATTAEYQAGGTYTADKSVTLYAVWSLGYCWQCNSPNNIYGWSDNTPTNGSCQSGWHKTDDTEENCGKNVSTYTVQYNANGGSGAPTAQTKTENQTLTLSSTVPTRPGYTFTGWNTKADGTGTSYSSGSSYTINTSVTLYAQWLLDEEEPLLNKYKIDYDLNGGTNPANPIEAIYDEYVTINNPSKSVIITGNDNNTDANINGNVTVELEFSGWTSSSINTNTAFYDDTPWSDGNVKVTATMFKNLIDIGKTVTLEANWNDIETELPVISKEGYSCSWNTESDGSGDNYESGDKYVVKGNDLSINLYAICKENSKIDEEVDESAKTGTTLIYVVWIIGLGAIGYVVYHFSKSKSNL